MGGWTGTVLRVDLTTGLITKEPITKYLPFLGGMGLGYKVLWDEVPPGTKAYDPANRVIFGGGPLTGTGTPLSARVTVTSLWPIHPEELPASGHMGGHWGPELKYAGYDALIVQGAAAAPVWIYIKDEVVEIRDAGKMWGNGIYRATAEIMNIMGSDARVAAIGQCGENLVRGSNVMCDRSHSAGGVGGVMGSKKLKAIGIIGTGSVRIEATKTAWKDLVQYQHTLLGANSGGVVPNTFQAWQPDGYYGGTRWTAANGRYWGAATPPVHTGDCTADDMNSIGLRTFKGFADFGPGVGDKHTVKIGGCHACPIRCHIATDVPALEAYGFSRYQVNTCNGNSTGSGFTTGIASRTEDNILASQAGVALSDDYGWWSDYGMAQADFKFLVTPLSLARWEELIGVGTVATANAGKSVYQVRLPAAEWTRIAGGTNPPTAASPLGKYFGTSIQGKVEFMMWLIPEISKNLMMDGTPATYEKMVAGQSPTGAGNATLGAYIALGAGRLEQLWPELAKEHQINVSGGNYLKQGHIKHHYTESTNVHQAAALINMFWNRDPQCHTHTNYTGNGLPLALKNEIFNELFGAEFPGSADAIDGATPQPMNQAKAVFAKLSLIYLALHNSMTLCNYTLPGWASPLKSRNYRGDIDIEAKFWTAVTGETVTRADMEKTGLRILTLFRALTALRMKSTRAEGWKDMRNDHDQLPEWSFHEHTGSTTLDHDDMEDAKDRFYTLLGWDTVTGLPTLATYNDLGLSDVATVMTAAGLMP
jgi:aldehyde:ferredoxin oxidoreductase